MAYVAIADQPEEELHDPQTFITKYVYSQDHKVIAIQYACTAIFVGIIALILSGTIVHEFLKGYKMGKRTIRPAKVKVVKEKELKKEDPASDEPRDVVRTEEARRADRAHGRTICQAPVGRH